MNRASYEVRACAFDGAMTAWQTPEELGQPPIPEIEVLFGRSSTLHHLVMHHDDGWMEFRRQLGDDQ